MFLLVIIVCGAPLMVYTSKEEVVFEPDKLVSRAVYLVEQMSHGTLGTYELGQTEREIAHDLLPFAVRSFGLLLGGVLLAVFISVIVGLFLQRFFLARLLQRLLDLLSAIPDFVLVLFSIMLAIQFYKWTQIRIITLSPNSDAVNSWFPMAVLAIGPTIFLTKVISLHYRQISGEDFIKTALAKGLGVWHVLRHHVWKNILPIVLADLKKTVAIAVSNLFVVEYTLNVVGLTRFIFSKGAPYQFNAAVMGLMAIILLSILVYYLVRLLLYVCTRTFVYE